MTQTMNRRRVLQAGGALGLSLLWPQARACEYITSTLRVIHPWTRATAAGADVAVLCMGFDEVTESDRLILVETPICTGAEMSGAVARPGVDFFIPAGVGSALSETGTHVRLIGLKFALETGRSYPMKLGFEKGGVFNASLSVDYPYLKPFA